MSLIKWLKSPLITKNLYFVIGEEAFFLSEIKKTFLSHLFSNSEEKDFNYNEFFADEKSVEELLLLLETLPFLTEKRLVFCYKAESFKAEDWEKLKSFLFPGLESVILVCFFEKKDSRKKPFVNFKEKAVELSATALRHWQMDSWLEFLFQKEGLNFSHSSKSLFKELVGENLMEIQLELKKLKQYLGKKNQVLEEDVLICTSQRKTENIFELISAIGDKNIPLALKALAGLLDQNQNEIGVLTMISKHMRSLSKIKEGEKQKLNQVGLAQKAGISSYFLNKYLCQSQIWSEEQIEKAVSALYETDKALKFSPLSSHILLENFILKACS